MFNFVSQNTIKMEGEGKWGANIVAPTVVKED